MGRRPSYAALAVTAGAFALYISTLLPGFDFGDTPSFQVMGGAAVITPRDGYPLYFAIAHAFTWVLSGDPAYAMNVASAVHGALACGLVVLVAFELSSSVASAIIAGLFFAGSYTLWSQSVITEVYALHVCFVAGTVFLLLRWRAHPTYGRLAAFFAVYALGFGNHLSMILLAPAAAAFILVSAPGGWRSLLTVPVVGSAAACALIGAMQYGWPFGGLWQTAMPPEGIADAFQAFWFDVTKADWRETMVLRVPASMILDRLHMYTFDVIQQFGWIGSALALSGGIRLLVVDWTTAVLVLGVYLVNVVFALGYNVGDTHVFFLPSHTMLAVLISLGVAALDRFARAYRWVHGLAAGIAVLRLSYNYPALDRSDDHRPRQVIETLTSGLHDQNAVLLADVNWQIGNGLNYFVRKVRADLSVAHMADVRLYLPALVDDNASVQRDVVLTAKARADLVASYGPLLPTDADPRVKVRKLLDGVRSLARGTRYVLCVLKPTREFRIDEDDLTSSVSLLTEGRLTSMPVGDYLGIAGVVGQTPVLVAAGETPFQRSVDIAGVHVEIRMESWLSFDTIRRMGFGHVVAARHHTLIVERGVSFASFDDEGKATDVFYGANIFESEPRYVVRLK